MEDTGNTTQNNSILEQVNTNTENASSLAYISSAYDNTTLTGIYEYSKLNSHINLLSCTLILSTFIFLAYYFILNGGRRS